jgi:hypothetical protein
MANQMSIEWPNSNILFACFFILVLAILSVFITSLAIAAYFHSPTIRQAHQNLFMLTLLINAIVFSLNLIIFVGYGALMGNSNILSNEWACSTNAFLNLFCCFIEIYTLMCIALERYFAIVKLKPLTLNQIIGLMVFGWIEVGLLSR